MGSASRGIVRRLGRFFSRVRPRVSQIARGGLSGATPRGQPWTSAVTLPQGRNGLIAWRVAVLSTFRAPFLCSHVSRELLRSALLDLTPIISATACHQRDYVARYSRFMIKAYKGKYHIPADLAVRGITAHRKPPDVRIWRLRNQSRVAQFIAVCSA